MSKDYKCPACQSAIDRAAVICSNPDCRKQLAFCSYCRDVTTYTLVEKSSGRFARDRFRCDRCEHMGVRCLTWAAGGYCNGLAFADGTWGRPLCANCNDKARSFGTGVLSLTLTAALGGLLRGRRPPPEH